MSISEKLRDRIAEVIYNNTSRPIFDCDALQDAHVRDIELVADRICKVFENESRVTVDTAIILENEILRGIAAKSIEHRREADDLKQRLVELQNMMNIPCGNMPGVVWLHISGTISPNEPKIMPWEYQKYVRGDIHDHRIQDLENHIVELGDEWVCMNIELSKLKDKVDV